METERLFVYGTLRPPLPDSEPVDSFNFPKVLPFLHKRSPAKLNGAELFDMNSFPAAVPGTGVIVGELLEIRSTAFEVLDPLEGHPDFYFRGRVTVETLDGDVEAWMYWAPEAFARKGVRIENGDWLRRL